MREIKRLADKRMLKDHIVAKHKTVFGSGLLMPIFVSNDEEAGIIIAETKEAQKLGEIIPVAVAERLSKDAKASAYLSFPKSENGLESLNALREWLDILEGYIEGEEQ